MTDQNLCDCCVDPHNRVVRSPLLLRSEALSFYVCLQDQGLLPRMCETFAGIYRVCYMEKTAVDAEAAASPE